MSKADIETVDAVVRWLTSLFGTFLLPVLGLVVIVYLVRSESAPARIKRLLEPFNSVKLLGQEFVLSHPDKVTSNAEATFRGYRSETKAKYDALVKDLHIIELHAKLLADVLGPAIVGKGKGSAFRSTIHVVDILFAESYYQLIPYVPVGGGEGRSWSIRYGIVGKTWRQAESNGEGNLKMSNEDLIHLWGMTAEEARTAKQTRPSLLAVMLRDGWTKVPVGILFADSTKTDAFGATKIEWMAMAERLEDGARKIGLTAALSSLVAALPKEPLIPMLGKNQG